MLSSCTGKKIVSGLLLVIVVITLVAVPTPQPVRAKAFYAPTASCTDIPPMPWGSLDGLIHRLLQRDAAGAFNPMGSSGVFLQNAFLQGSNTEYSDEFGYAIAISGDTLVVGAMNEDSSASGIDGAQNNNDAKDSGAVYVFVNHDGFWDQQAYIKSSNSEACDYFGYSVALSGDTLVVGAIGEASNAAGDQANNDLEQAGAAYVFVRDGTSWTQQAYLKAPYPDTNDNFGNSVAVSGDTIVIGANQEWSDATGVDWDASNNSMVAAGAAYVFVRNGTDWSQQAYLKASNTQAANQFGFSVGISGDTIVVGAKQESSGSSGVNGNQSQTVNPRNQAGAAYVFVREGTTWSQQAYLKASNPNAWYYFGISVAIDGETVVVGSNAEWGGSAGVNGNQSNQTVGGSGAAYVFVRDGETWSQQAYLKSDHPMQNDEFGRTVGITGDTIVVGIPFDDGLATDSGGAYVFSREGTTWSQQDFLKSADPGKYDLLGWSVSASGGAMAVGSPFLDWESSSGASSLLVQSGSTGKNAAYVFATTSPQPPQKPQITLLGNNQLIPNGDLSPSASDDTDFGSVGDGQESLKVFTIRNSGSADLTLSGSPVVVISGSPEGQFSVVSDPSSPVSAGSSTTFSIGFHPTGDAGLRQSTVTIASDSETDAVYQFSIQGTHTQTISLIPQIAVLGKDQPIANGDNTPSNSDNTDFGTVAEGQEASLSFTIGNTGTADLVLTGNPLVEISGPAVDQFCVTANPVSPISPSAQATFTIRFKPSGDAGVKIANVSIASNGGSDPLYQFVIQGQNIPSKKLFFPLFLPLLNN